MRIAVFSAGGVGGYLAARLLKAGSDVAIIARGKHLEAIRRDGLTLAMPKETFTVHPEAATDDPASVGAVDMVIFAVKMPDLPAAAAAAKPLLGPDTGVVPFQNGVEATDLLAPIVGNSHAMSGTCYIFSDIAAPGRIEQVGAPGRFFFAEGDGSQSERSRALREEFKAAGIDAPEPADMRLEVWRKFVYLVSMAGMTAATRSPIGVVRADPAMRATFQHAVEEALAVGAAEGVALPPDSLTRYFQFLDGSPPGARSSLAKDLAAGKPLEIEWLSGAVHRLGVARGVPTPIHTALYSVLKPFANGTPPSGR